MRTIRAKRVFVLLLLGLSITAWAAPLRFCYESAPEPPWTMPDGSGAVLDLLRTVADHLHEQFVLLPIPWKRCIEEVRVAEMDGAIGSADIPERRLLGKLPLLADGKADPTAAVYEEYYFVYSRTGSGAGWDGAHLIVPRGGIVIPRGYSIAVELRSQGYKVLESVDRGEDGLRMLRAGMADIAILPSLETHTLALGARFRDSITVAPQAWKLLYGYLLVSNASYQQSPARIQAIWNSIRETRRSAESAKPGNDKGDSRN
jgi:polar amino acid transport system substrate-binding protein